MHQQRPRRKKTDPFRRWFYRCVAVLLLGGVVAALLTVALRAPTAWHIYGISILIASMAIIAFAVAGDVSLADALRCIREINPRGSGTMPPPSDDNGQPGKSAEVGNAEAGIAPMVLHEAIAEVLRRNGSSMTYAEIADALTTSKLYVKRDGSMITPDQIRARVSKPRYALKFHREGGRLSLVRPNVS